MQHNLSIYQYDNIQSACIQRETSGQARLFLNPNSETQVRAFPPRTACIIHPQINKPAATALPKAPDSLPHIKVNIRPRNKRFCCSHRLAKNRDVRSACLQQSVSCENNKIWTNMIMPKKQPTIFLQQLHQLINMLTVKTLKIYGLVFMHLFEDHPS